MTKNSVNCDCEICKHFHEFELHHDLIESFLRGDVAIFAGAGISTESRRVLKNTFYEEVAGENGKINSNLSFPDLMQEYCEQPNGRFKLLQKIENRFNHIFSFPELEHSATLFHKELATFFPQKTIVTTNWDTYFEKYCGATPFVTDKDLVFWNEAKRKVLKIHGSINNYGSIVASTSDYKECEKSLDKGIIGSILKTILATQTVVFVGYSLSDFDFTNIYNFVQKQMEGLHKQAYVVTPFENEREKFIDLGLIPIITDGTFFMQKIKQYAVEKGIMLPDSTYDYAYELLEILYEEHEILHEKVNCHKHPQILYASSYQDGMIHALQRAIQLRSTGHYSHACNIRGVFDPYLEIQKERLKKKIYEDVAYIEGYTNSLIYLLLNEEERKEEFPPLYYAFGVKDELYTFEDFEAILSTLPKKHKASYNRTLKKVGTLESNEGVDFHHPPWL